MKINNVLLIVISVFALSSFFQGKGVKMISTTKYFRNSQSLTSKSIIYLEDDKLKIDVSNSHHNTSLIYDSNEQKLWVLDHRRKLFLLLTKEQIKSFRSQKLAKNHYYTLWKDLINKPYNIDSDSSFTIKAYYTPTYYIKKSDQNNINGWKCIKYEGYQDQKVIQELWTTSLKDLKLTQQDITILDNFSQFIKYIPLELLETFETFKLPNKEHDGIAVSGRSLYEGQVVAVHTLDKVEKTNLASSIFEVPSYKPIAYTQLMRN